MCREMKGELISIVMPTYNQKNYLRQAVESVLKQTYTNIELVIVDSSTDLSIWKGIDLSNPHISYYWREKNGIADALNYGMIKAHGKYIARMDSDDVSHLTRIEKQYNFLKDNQEIDIVGAYANIIDKDDRIIGKMYAPIEMEQMKAQLLNGGCFIHPTVFFRRKLIDQGFRYDGDYVSEDYEAWSRLILKYRFSNIPEELLDYRMHGGNLSSNSYLGIGDSDARISRKYLENMFHVNMNNYSSVDTVVHKNVFGSGVSLVDYVVNRAKLLNKVWNNNQEGKYVESGNLLVELSKQWIHVLSYFDLSLIRDDKSVNGLWDGLSDSNSFLADKLKEILCCKKEEVFYVLKKDLQELEEKINIHLKREYSFILYGLGRRGSSFLEYYWNSNVKTRSINWKMLGVSDRDTNKMQRYRERYNTIPIDDVNTSDADIILVTQKDFEGVRKELVEMGVDENKMVSANMFI